MRLHFVVEGQTEETFVRDVLCPELALLGIFCDAHRVRTGRRRGKVYSGGFVSFQHLRNDLQLWMRQDSKVDSWFTTMIDLYRLPSDFPGFAKSRLITDAVQRVKFLEEQFKSDLGHSRFVPYIQLHEFEALLFSDAERFDTAFPSLSTNELKSLNAIRGAFKTPEHIDDGDDTSPSKRILQILPQYTKPVSGPLIAKQIGLAKLREECHHFNRWLKRLEAAEQSQSPQ